jgi:xylulokinase
LALAGLDVGTSGCKFTVYTNKGRRLLTARRNYSEFSAGEGWRELDPELVLQKVLEVINEGCRLSPETIEAFAIASMGETTIVVDETGKSLQNAMVTGDSRGIAETKRLMESKSAGAIMEITGVPPSEMYSLPKWMWINDQTDVFQKGKYLFLFEDYIAWHLTGQRKVSHSSAARTMAFDIEKKQWNQELLQIAGLSPDKMSEIVPSGTIIGEVLPEIAKRHGLHPGMKVVSGGHDQNMATLGAGVNNPGIAEDCLGTCEVFSAMLPGVMKNEYMLKNDLVCIPYVYPDTYLTYIVLPTMGILMNWVTETLFTHLNWECGQTGKKTIAQMDKMISTTPSGLLALPQFGSAGIPDVDYDAKGLIWGLTVHTKPSQIYQAALECMSYHIYMAYRLLEPLGIKHETLRLTGGGSYSEPILQMRADVFGLPVQQMENPECSAAGCMLLAGKAIGIFDSMDRAIENTISVRKTFKPDFKRREAYIREYEKYEKLYHMIHDFKG